MKNLLLLLTALPISVFSIDHSKLDFGRPLRIDDAHPLALGEMALKFGVSSVRSHSSPKHEFETSYLYGFAPAMHVEVGLGSGIESNKSEADGHVSLFIGLTRETPSTFAAAVRFDARFEDANTSLLARGILGGRMGDYGKWHFNGDIVAQLDPSFWKRSFSLAAAIGYSSPIGMPRDFTQTIVAAINLNQSLVKAEGWTSSFAIGLRKQIGIREVMDIGLETDFLASKGAPRNALKVVLGYSKSF